MVKPEIHEFETFSEFAGVFELGKNDLILTNVCIYEPLNAGVSCNVIYQENLGGGKPTDKIVQAIMDKAGKYTYSRLVALGGRTIIDIAKPDYLT